MTDVLVPEDKITHGSTKEERSRYILKKYPERKLPFETESICDKCLLENNEVRVIKMTVYEENGKAMLKKTCPVHGETVDVYWGDAKLLERAFKYWYKSVGLDNPRTKTVKGCPEDCGLCPFHKSHTALGLIDVTNRCNLRCPICFANAAHSGTVYEPTPEQIYEILKNLRANRPVPAPAVQFAGGEPTVSEHLPQYIKWAKELGFKHVEIATNAIRIANSLKYAKKLKEAGLSTLYMQFDGLTPEPYIAARGENLLPKKLQAIENARKAGLNSIVLVPTLVRGLNDNQVGDIVNFAVENRDVIRGVNFQPVSITGRINREERNNMRITIPDLIHLMDEQTEGRIKPHDWYPVPVVLPIGRVLGLLKGHPQLELSCHPACGAATFIIMDEDGKDYEPITKYINVDNLLKTLEGINNDLVNGGRISRMKAKFRIAGSIRHFKKKGALKDLLNAFFNRADYDSLAEFMQRVIMVSAMHFQDPYNIDLERVQHCDINYGIPDGRIIPFCTMNTIHRPRVEEKFSVSIKEWLASKKKLTEVEKDSVREALEE